jgi:hypothetical protein
VLAHDGQSVPAAGSGVTIYTLGTGIVDDAGRVTFRVVLEGDGVDSSNDYSLLRSDGAGGLELVVREGDPAPGAAGAEFDYYALNGAPAGLDHIGVSATLRGEGVGSNNDQGIWLWEDPGTLSLVARNGDPAPGTEGFLFNDARRFEANSSGQLALQSSLANQWGGSTDRTGIWLHDPTSGTQIVAQSREPAPGTPAGTEFTRLAMPELNDAGQIAFSALTTDGVGSYPYPGGIWSTDGPGEPLALRHLTGDDAPGTPPDVTFGGFALSDMNGGGELVFKGRLTGSGITFDNDEGIWGPDGAGGLALIAREGSPATGVAGDARWGHATTEPFGPASLNDAGEVAFKGGLVGGDVSWDNDWGIWGTDGSGGITLIAREGDPVPDLLGVSFLELKTLTPLLNEHGDVAFKATWAEVTEEGEEYGWGLFVRTAEGAFRTVVRSGDLIEVEPGIFHEVYEPSLGNFDDARQLTYRVFFTGGRTGIFLTTVPEPGTAALLALGLTAFTLATRKRRG